MRRWMRRGEPCAVAASTFAAWGEMLISSDVSNPLDDCFQLLLAVRVELDARETSAEGLLDTPWFIGRCDQRELCDTLQHRPVDAPLGEAWHLPLVQSDEENLLGIGRQAVNFVGQEDVAMF